MSVDVFTIIPNWLPGWAAAGGSAGGGFFVVKWFVEFISGRLDKRAASLDADTRFIIDNLRGEMRRMSDRLSEAETQISDLRGKLLLCEEQHTGSRAEVTRLTAMMQGYGDARTKIQLERAAEKLNERSSIIEG